MILWAGGTRETVLEALSTVVTSLKAFPHVVLQPIFTCWSIQYVTMVRSVQAMNLLEFITRECPVEDSRSFEMESHHSLTRGATSMITAAIY